MISGYWRITALVCRVILGTVFIYASLDKIMNPEAFAAIIFNYKILPQALVGPAAVCLPWVELFFGFLLITGRLGFASALVLSTLLLVFATAIGFNLARGLDFQCGCFTTSAKTGGSNTTTLIRDLVLFISALVCLIDGFKKERPGAGTPQLS